MRLSVAVMLILSACGPLPAHEDADRSTVVRDGEGSWTDSAARPSERVATGAIGGSAAGDTLGGGPLTGDVIGPVH
ncbi:hypothetical protein [Falsirhodobacter halotolerans]|uniref:hypothetical protein n=1 Tax=Falsirhodobacter halotolerans TaxID=1146892 RepID=UPI001FD615CD|nr:hypothetical protein [Falsirhodobacter halotolerans]MCJ8138909.1 hypothetical protein [Falsirhodobacter halotolerans]